MSLGVFKRFILNMQRREQDMSGVFSGGNDHFIFEMEGWLRELEYFLATVSHMKTRLAYVVEKLQDQSLLEEAEVCQNELVEIGNQLQQLRMENKKVMEELPLKLITVHPAVEKKYLQQHKELKAAHLNVKEFFEKVRTHFDQFHEKTRFMA